MSTTFTTSATTTFTVTHARYLVSKIAADLLQMQHFYGHSGHPTDAEIEQYIAEAVVMLLRGHLKDVTYGFRKSGEWIVAVKYDARMSGGLPDDRSGRVRPGVDISGASWGSFMNYTEKYHRLTSSELEELQKLLPFSRANASEPRANIRTADKSYSSGGVSLQREMLTSI